MKPKSKGGRPSFVATPALRRKVQDHLACGMSEVQIAIVIGCSRATLWKHFRDEMLNGRTAKRAEINSILWREARKGKGWAIKRIQELGAIADAEADFLGEPEPIGPKLGKKEEAAIAATTAGEGTDWGDDLRTEGARH